MWEYTIINIIDSNMEGCSRADYKSAQEIAGKIKDDNLPDDLENYIVYEFKDGLRLRCYDIDEFLRMEEKSDE